MHEMWYPQGERADEEVPDMCAIQSMMEYPALAFTTPQTHSAYINRPSLRRQELCRCFWRSILINQLDTLQSPKHKLSLLFCNLSRMSAWQKGQISLCFPCVALGKIKSNSTRVYLFQEPECEIWVFWRIYHSSNSFKGAPPGIPYTAE